VNDGAPWRKHSLTFELEDEGGLRREVSAGHRRQTCYSGCKQARPGSTRTPPVVGEQASRLLPAVEHEATALALEDHPNIGEAHRPEPLRLDLERVVPLVDHLGMAAEKA
jgi:hypothetical protein